MKWMASRINVKIGKRVQKDRSFSDVNDQQKNFNRMTLDNHRHENDFSQGAEKSQLIILFQ